MKNQQLLVLLAGATSPLAASVAYRLLEYCKKNSRQRVVTIIGSYG